MKQKGFTLIELLVVISIIGLLASIALVSLNSARAKARDTRKIADFKQLGTALQLFIDKNDRVPINQVPGQEVCEFGTNPAQYVTAMQELVNAGFLAGTPHSPGPQGYAQGYCYYDYGKGNTIGGLLVTRLEAATPSSTGLQPSCRPWGAGINWCDQSVNNYYCICNPY